MKPWDLVVIFVRSMYSTSSGVNTRNAARWSPDFGTILPSHFSVPSLREILNRASPTVRASTVTTSSLTCNGKPVPLGRIQSKKAPTTIPWALLEGRNRASINFLSEWGAHATVPMLEPVEIIKGQDFIHFTVHQGASKAFPDDGSELSSASTKPALRNARTKDRARSHSPSRQLIAVENQHLHSHNPSLSKHAPRRGVYHAKRSVSQPSPDLTRRSARRASATSSPRLHGVCLRPSTGRRRRRGASPTFHLPAGFASSRVHVATDRDKAFMTSKAAHRSLEGLLHDRSDGLGVGGASLRHCSKGARSAQTAVNEAVCLRALFGALMTWASGGPQTPVGSVGPRRLFGLLLRFILLLARELDGVLREH